MPLPKISTPTYELELPSTGKKIKYRPFLVKEEKILIIAMESEDEKQITNAIKDVISSCIITRGVKVEQLSTFDIEYLFLNPTSINLDDIKVQKGKNHTRDIKLDDNLILRMKYPSVDEFIKNNFGGQDITVDDTFDLIASCVEQVYSEEESWSAADCTKKELKQFLEQLSSKQFKEIETFFETMPKLSHTVSVTNPETGVKSDIVLEGLTAFFG
jgi:hypothetical protein